MAGASKLAFSVLRPYIEQFCPNPLGDSLLSSDLTIWLFLWTWQGKTDGHRWLWSPGTAVGNSQQRQTLGCGFSHIRWGHLRFSVCAHSEPFSRLTVQWSGQRCLTGSSSYQPGSLCAGEPHGWDSEEPASNEGDPSSTPGSGRSPGEGNGNPLQYSCVSLMAQLVKNLPAMWETRVRFLGQEDPLEKEMATHSSTLAWKILWATIHGDAESRTRLSSFTFTY